MNAAPSYPQSVFNTNHHVISSFLDNPALAGAPNHKVFKHQLEAAINIRDWFRNAELPKTALVVLPTGTGKSGIAVLAPYATNSTRVLVLTPSVVITKQIADTFGNFLVSRGVFLTRDRSKFTPSTAAVTRTVQLRQALAANVNVIIVNAHKIGQKVCCLLSHQLSIYLLLIPFCEFRTEYQLAKYRLMPLTLSL